jgi:ABC-type dipeptide/oligopeptide/nickel transport system permease subunit
MSVAWWIVIAGIVVFLFFLAVLVVGRRLPRKDDPEYAESATRAREGRDPGQD